jgi:threonine dehydrogenase-like Zn-dependent dehydrogenase
MGEVYERTISMVEKGLVSLDDLATHTYSLNDGEQAFLNNLDYKDNVLKSIIFPNT